jgi:TPR repeat protein
MTILRRIGEALFGPDTSDKEFYSYVADEIASGVVDAGLWAKALADTNYDEKKARALYITSRVKTVKEEVAQIRKIESQYAALRHQLEASYERRDYRSCFDGWATLAEQGDPLAQYRLATLYANGQGTSVDTYRAYFWACVAEMSGFREAKPLRTMLIPRMMSWDIKRAEEEAQNRCRTVGRSLAPE